MTLRTKGNKDINEIELGTFRNMNKKRRRSEEHTEFHHRDQSGTSKGEVQNKEYETMNTPRKKLKQQEVPEIVPEDADPDNPSEQYNPSELRSRKVKTWNNFTSGPRIVPETSEHQRAEPLH